MSSAVVTTVRDPDKYFRWWINYHLKYFSWVYIFLDTDPLPHVNIPSSDRTTILPGAKRTIQNSPSAVMDRQMINVNQAIELAAIAGYEWVVHIDSDELVFTDGKEFSRAVSKYSKHNVLTMVNHESIITSDTYDNYFLNPYFRNGNLNNQAFLAYENGKAAVRIEKNEKPQACGVHDFDFKNKRVKSCTISEPCILHFPNASYEQWLKKYASLGNFSDWWYDDRSEPIELEFHVRSRDVVQKCLRKNEFTEAYLFYKSTVLNNQTVLSKPSVLKIKV